MHLSDEQLHEYLDQALSTEKRAEAVRHLAACADCTGRLTALRSLFAEIGSIPDVTLARDLAGPVVRALRPAPASRTETGRPVLPRWVQLTAGLQAAAALLAIVFAAPLITELLSPWTAAYQLPATADLLFELQAQWTAVLLSLQEFSIPSIPLPAFDISSLALTMTAVVAFLVWVAGNRLLLRRVA